MPSFVENLKKPVGPLPLGVWLVVVGTGLGIAYYAWKHQGQGTGAATPEEPGRDVSTDAGVGMGGGQFVYQAPATVVGENPITTNEEWAKAAINYLIAEGYDPSRVDAAIRRYIGGNDADTQDLTLINLALAKLGSPPGVLPPQEPTGPKSLGYFQKAGDPAIYEGYENNTRRWITATEWAKITQDNAGRSPVVQVLEAANAFWKFTLIGGLIPPPVVKPPAKPVKPAPKPKPKPPAKKPAHIRYVTVTHWPSKHGSLWGIAKDYYGNGALWPRIFNANRKGHRRADGSMGMISNPNLIYDGWKLIVP